MVFDWLMLITQDKVFQQYPSHAFNSLLYVLYFVLTTNIARFMNIYIDIKCNCL